MSIVSIGQNIATLLDICSITCGNGSPEGVVTANPASLFLQKDGATASKLWQKDAGTGNTGWILIGVSMTLTDTVNAINTAVANIALKQNRWVETRIGIQGLGQNDGDTFVAADFVAETRYSPIGVLINAQAMMVVPSGFFNQFSYHIVDQRHCWKIKPATPAGAGQSKNVHFRPYNISGTVPQRIDFRESFGSMVSPALDASVPLPLACSISAYLRKEAGGDSSDARFTFGFCDFAVTAPSATVARNGLIGDGAGGYRFGSVNCPDGAAAGENGPTDIDVNSFQPAGLVAPSTNWFHVRIKMIPPTPTQTGRWGAYLNGVLQATFTSNANFPRGSGATNRNYANIEPLIYSASAASQLPGVLIDDLRVTFEENYTL